MTRPRRWMWLMGCRPEGNRPTTCSMIVVLDLAEDSIAPGSPGAVRNPSGCARMVPVAADGENWWRGRDSAAL